MSRIRFRAIAATATLAVVGSGFVSMISAQTIEPPSGAYRIRNECGQKLLGLRNAQQLPWANPWDDAIVVDGSPASAVWNIEPQTDGSSVIVAAGTRSALQTANGKTTRGTDVDLWTANGWPSQKWKIIPTSSGTVKFTSVAAPGMALDLAAAGANGNTNVQLWTANRTCAQRWRLEPVNNPQPTTGPTTTVAPTTAAPTTAAPTTAAPTTVAPTTAVPTTVAPTTVAPTTAAPTTVAPTTAAPTGTWYVATNGRDTNAGSQAEPFATLNKAAEAVQPGQTIVVRSGTYNLSSAALIQNKRGTAAQPITVLGEGLPVFRPTDRNVVPANYNGLISVSNSSHIVISGIRLENSGQFGFHVTRSDHVTVKNSQSAGTKLSAFWADNSTDIAVTANDFSDFCDRGQFNNVGCQEGVSLETVDRFDVGYNRVHDAPQVDGIGPGGGEGIDAKYGSKNGRIHHNNVEDLPQLGIYVDGWLTGGANIEIDNNFVRKTYLGIVVGSEQGGAVTGISIHDNVVVDVGYDAIAVGAQGTDGPKGDIAIFSNTLVGNGKAANKPPFCILWGESPCPAYGGGVRIDSKNLTGVVSVYDNIITDSATSDIAVPPAVQPKVAISNNVFWSPNGNLFDDNVSGTGAINADPLFLNPGARDYRLQPGSPAAGKGARR
jgi:hypothetical protein